MKGGGMMPGLWTQMEGVTMAPSISIEKSWVELVWEVGPMMMISDLLQFISKTCLRHIINSKYTHTIYNHQ